MNWRFNIELCGFFYRKRQKRDEAEVSWDEQKAESDHRKRIRKEEEKRRKKKSAVVWDDAEERKCQERYRKKYSSCN